MREIEEEIREIKKEIIESRGLVIKTNNIANTLGSDIKTIAKRQAAHERRAWWNSIAAYALLGAACLFGFRLLLDASVREIELEKENLQQEVKRLRGALDQEVQRAEKRVQAETRAMQFLELVQNQRRAEAVERFRELDKEQLSPAERALFREIVERFHAELSAEAYQAGLELARAGRITDAAERFEAAIRLDESAAHAAKARYQLAEAERQLGKYAQAKLEVERVLEQNSDRDIHAAATLLLARILDELGDGDGARAQLRKLLAKYPHSSVLLDARQLLGQLNEKAGR
ncbi:MAG TPA: tetratricopeptide repeat protein [Polyangiaceae bacterium]|nr:tetratricopeptide repeat protein [Polyangiaceae bacterium]